MLDKIITFLSQSSEDPTKTSASLTGALIFIASYLQQYSDTIPFLGKFFTSEIGQNLDPILTSIGMTVGGIICLFGLLRKLTNKVESSQGLRVE